MQHTAIPEPPGFAELSKDEQIRYLQALWDRVTKASADVPVPERHLDLAEKRLASYRRDPTRARSAYEVLDRLSSGRR